MHYFIGFLLSILLTACATTNYYTKTVDSWHGANANLLINRWGKPDDKITSPQGNSIYVYKTSSYKPTAGPSSPMIGVGFNPHGKPVITTIPNTNVWNRGISITCITLFITNKQGTIIDTKVQGNNCYGNETFATRMGNPNTTIVSSNQR